jgi:hypothetical protein
MGLNEVFNQDLQRDLIHHTSAAIFTFLGTGYFRGHPGPMSDPTYRRILVVHLTFGRTCCSFDKLPLPSTYD